MSIQRYKTLICYAIQLNLIVPPELIVLPWFYAGSTDSTLYVLQYEKF